MKQYEKAKGEKERVQWSKSQQDISAKTKRRHLSQLVPNTLFHLDKRGGSFRGRTAQLGNHGALRYSACSSVQPQGSASSAFTLLLHVRPVPCNPRRLSSSFWPSLALPPRGPRGQQVVLFSQAVLLSQVLTSHMISSATLSCLFSSSSNDSLTLLREAYNYDQHLLFSLCKRRILPP